MDRITKKLVNIVEPPFQVEVIFYGPWHAKMCLIAYVSNNGADQTVY